MSKTIIEVKDLSKLYKLGSIGTGTLSHDLNRWWQKKVGKKDPFLEKALLDDASNSGNNEYIWSLKDINFEVKEGEIFGVIGKNGAGKSTLLKILSKITKPTTGVVHLNGRIASLLEVGTGFHPDLTGRENVYLNGAILGMKKTEIERKFDEILDFSGVERFIDTPVKRYSSGMYVRLAFAVAAHLEPEILIIDEVLAVGDAEFQRKCMGKIKDVSFNQGRTILFVSHNIVAIKQLCSKVLFLESGRQKAVGNVKEVVRLYQQKMNDTDAGKRGSLPQHLPGFFVEWQLESNQPQHSHACVSRELCTFNYSVVVSEFLSNCEFRISMINEEAVILNASSLDNKGVHFSLEPGHYHFKLSVQLPINPGPYNIEAGLISNSLVIDLWNSSTPLIVLDNYEKQTAGGILNVHSSFNIEETIDDRSFLILPAHVTK